MDESTFDVDINKLISQKDAYTEVFLNKIVSLLKLPQNATPDEIHAAWTNQMSSTISDMSSILWHRLNPYVQILLQRKMKNIISDQMVTIDVASEPLVDLVTKYKICFNTWIDSEYVLFNTLNREALGNLSMKDYFILQFFIMGTNVRVRGDHCLQLGIVGKSSVGKSTLFESPLSEISHYYVNERGTGRFKTDGKAILFFHDVDMKTLVFCRDKDLIKTLARTEATQAKVHSSICCIPPIHLLYTSNTKLFNYNRTGSNTFGSAFETDVPVKEKNKAHVDSFKMRFLECFCFKRPLNIHQDWLPCAGMFQKQHMILGIYDRVVDILLKISSNAFYKPVQIHYILAGLTKNAQLYNSVFPNVDLKICLVNLIEKFNLSSTQKMDILKYLNY